jgi:hypothetical protein
MTNILNIAVASDLHAYESPSSDTSNSPSHLKISLPENEPGKHPISGLLQLIEIESLKADLFLCPGDIGDKAQRAGIQYGWKAIHEVGLKLGASLIAAATGNHDLDSRYISTEDADAKGFLLSLKPPYPLSDEAMNDKYWARNYVIVEGDQYRLVVLNSSAYHGTALGEIDHGRISGATLSFLANDLDRLKPKLVNLLLCHHHPQQHMELKLGDYDAMTNGQLLLDTLGSGRYGRWLIIHGHKHHPKVTYASGAATSPVIFSAGSLCAKLYLELQTKARNQFYLISLSYDHVRDFGLVGTVKAWDWAYGEGWAAAEGVKSGLPSESAFGYRGDPLQIAKRLSTLVVEKMAWDEVRISVPEASYYLPQDLETLERELQAVGLHITEEHGRPREIGRSL